MMARTRFITEWGFRNHIKLKIEAEALKRRLRRTLLRLAVCNMQRGKVGQEPMRSRLVETEKQKSILKTPTRKTSQVY